MGEHLRHVGPCNPDCRPGDMVSVPAHLLAAIDRMIAARTDEDPAPFHAAFHDVVAARAVVDAVETEDETVPNILTGERVKPWMKVSSTVPDAAVGACEHAEGLLRHYDIELRKAWDEVDFWKDNDNKRSAKVRKMRAEREALRERIRALADEWEKDANTACEGTHHVCSDCVGAAFASDIRAALGDA